MDKETKKQFQNLTKLVKNGFEEAKKDRATIRKTIDEKIEGLARMVKKGFDHVDERFDQNQKEHQDMKKQHAEMTLDLEEISSKLKGGAKK